MNDNIPPIPPAPRAPETAPQYAPQPYGHTHERYGQSAYPAPARPHYAAPSGYQGQPNYGPPQGNPPQGYATPGPYAQPQHGSYYQQPGQWVPAPSLPRSSGHRVAAGIIGIMLGTWLFIPSIAGFSEGGAGSMSFLILVAALGNLTAGIVLLANQRRRNQGPPITSLSFAGLALLLGLIGMAVPYFGVALLVTSLILAAPVLIVMGIGLSREKRAV